jgi:transcriptional regulator with XRE-family HTH domain
MYKQIGRKVAYYRQLRELTQEQLASRIHISTSSISRIERGKYNNNIPLSMLMVIAEGLKIDLAMLVTFNEQEKKIRWDGL